MFTRNQQIKRVFTNMSCYRYVLLESHGGEQIQEYSRVRVTSNIHMEIEIVG